MNNNSVSKFFFIITKVIKYNKVHKTIMGRIAGTPNKITAEVKEKLQVVID